MDHLGGIREIGVYHNALTFQIEIGGRRYTISQAPTSRRTKDPNSLKYTTKRRRELGDYTVLEVGYGAKAEWIMYVSKRASLTVSVDPLEFNDTRLDKLIECFKPLDKEK
jgi:hypothetical protein